MSARFIQHGDAIDYTPPAAVFAGAVILLGDTFGVARTPIAAGQLGSLAVKGTFAFPKNTGSGQAIENGKEVYYDSVAEHIRKTNNTNSEKIGRAVMDAGDDDEVIHVRLTDA
ncbi:MAG: DUF2190 family protein [Planctomycetes bacterium]|nr:DUF2190 family protein [Planctomycetota bacterium]